MNSKSVFVVLLALFALAAARPKKGSSLETEASPEAEAETKIREKRKYEIPLLRQLEEGGVGVKREAPPEAESPSKTKEGEEGGAGEPEDASSRGLRVKKQSPNNVGGCGKTVCGPMVSARGAVIGDARAMLQGGSPMLPMGDLRSGQLVNEMSDAASKLDGFGPVQGRTVDAIVAPVALGTLGYGTPAAYAAAPPAIELGHSFFKPPAASAVPAVAVIAAPHQPPHPLVHPWLVSHLVPHLLPHVVPHVAPSLAPGLGSYFAPHRLEPVRFPETLQTEEKQPAPSFPQPFYAAADNALLCQPLRTQRLDAPYYDLLYRPDVAGDKSINVTDGSKRSQNDADGDEERKMRDHLRKVNEIKDEITQLNRAAQRIVDQQERLTAMQQKQMWGSSELPSSERSTVPYMGSGYYAHPAMPWGYSRSNILSYPRSEDDIDFFFNLLRAGKKMGLLSDAVQPSVLSTIGGVLKGVQDGSKGQKDAVDGVAQSDDGKGGKADKKSSE